MAARRRRGTTLIELMITVGVYSFLVISLFSLTQQGTSNWHSIESRANVQSSLRSAERDMITEIRRSSYSSLVINMNTGYQHAILVKSAMNTVDNVNVLGDPLNFIVDNTAQPPVPKWQRYVLYYVTRQSFNDHMANYGFVCAAPSGNSDDICPHKMLVRKDVMLAAAQPSATQPLFGATPNTVHNTSEYDYIEAAGQEADQTNLYAEAAGSGAPFSNPYIQRVRVLANNILSFNVGVFASDGVTPVATPANLLPTTPSIIEFDLKAFKMTEAAQFVAVGSQSLVTYPGGPGSGPPGTNTTYETATAPFSIQLDNRVVPQNP